MTETTIGFIGLGIMGKPMSRHLLDAGYPLVVHNRSRAAVHLLVQAGAREAFSPREVAEQSQIIITMLPDSPDVELVYLGSGGVLDGVRPDTLLIDMSSASPATAIKVAEAAAAKDCLMLDAPVSGGDVGAHNATLSIMVGGEEEAFERAKPIFEVLGTPVLCGKNGAGQTVKACNQVQVALNFVGMCEALVLAAKAGVDPALVVQVLSGGYAQSRVMDDCGARIVKGDFEPGGHNQSLHKDLNIVRETARACGCALPGAALAHELLTAAQANGWGHLDNSAMIKVFEALSGVEARTREG